MKKNIFLLAIVFLFTGINLSAQMPSREEWERLQKESSKDHALMMEMLGISEIRPGPSGDSKAPNAANSDESKATAYESLPDPLTFNDGTKVKTAEQWEKRREELFELFDREVYGRIPENIPGVTWEHGLMQRVCFWQGYMPDRYMNCLVENLLEPMSFHHRKQPSQMVILHSGSTKGAIL